MADVQYTQTMGAPGYSDPDGSYEKQRSGRLASFANVLGAIMSLSLIVGISVWGYKLVVRDVSGIPVVRAAEGEMRVSPEDPGGQLALNQGLAVNAVAADGSAETTSETVVLAPPPVDLTEEDLQPTAEPAAPVEQPQPLDVSASLDQDIDRLVAQLAEETQPILASATSADVIDAPGLKSSLRPFLRPASVRTVAPPAPRTVQDVAADTIPAGTRLVQLGAFDTVDLAHERWSSLDAKFADYLSGKGRVVQKAETSGRTFYRLRAAGFETLSDARRFCSALLAEGAECIPVVTR
ncbi:MAG: SPOR domain-containing protein [Pseudomonadota bacterium]